MIAGGQIKRGAAFILGGRFVNQGLQFAITILLARALVPADFGYVAAVSVFTGLAGFAASGGLGSALVRADAIDERDCQVIFTAQFLIGTAIFLCLYVLAGWVGHFYGDILYRDLLRVSAVSFIFRPLVQMPSMLLVRDMKFGVQALAHTMSVITYGVVSVSLAWRGFGPWSIILGGLANMPVLYIVMRWSHPWPARLNFDLHRWKKFAGVGFRFSVNDIADNARQRVPHLMIARVGGESLLGIVNFAVSLSNLAATFVSTAIYNPVFRALSSEKHDLGKSKYLYSKSIVAASVYALPVVAVLAVSAPDVVMLLYGQKWLDVAPLLRVLCLTAPFAIVMNLSGAVIAAQDDLAREVWVHVRALIIILLGIAVLYPLFSAWGIIVSLMVSLVYASVAHARIATEALGATLRTPIVAVLQALPVTAAALAAALSGRVFVVEPLAGVFGDTLSGAAVPVVLGGLGALVVLVFSPPEVLAEDIGAIRRTMTTRLVAVLPGRRRG